MKKIDRVSFLYMEPNEHSFGSHNKFAQCETCTMFTGDKCTILGQHVFVPPGATCALYVNGKPSMDMKGKEQNLVTPEVAGFEIRQVRCENCAYYEEDDNDCDLFEILNNVKGIMMQEKVHKYGCCNANVPIAPSGPKVIDMRMFKKK